MTALDVDRVAELACGEVERIGDSIVREELRARLRTPVLHEREWDYGLPEDRFACWTVVEDESSDTAIVYSEFGFGPHSPWGLVSVSNLSFGMDSGWFRRLEDAFVDSFMACPLPIWDLVAPDGSSVLASVTSHEAFAARDRIDAGLVRPRHSVVYRSRLPGGIP
jgi:hypothetical protein